MKYCKSLIPFIVLYLLFSCTPKEKYYGEWVMYNGNWLRMQADWIKISEDSITISEFPYVNFYSEKLQLKRGKIQLLNTEFRIQLLNDSILKFNDSEFIRKGSQYYDEFKIDKKLNIEFPKLEDAYEGVIWNGSKSAKIYYGIRLDSNKYSLQLDEHLVNSIGDLRWYLHNSRPLHSLRVQINLLADRNAKMSEINWLFKEFRAMNFLKLSLINHQEFTIENDTIIWSKMVGIPLRLSYIKEEIYPEIDSVFYSEAYGIPYTFSKSNIPPPPGSSLRENLAENKDFVVMSLINDEYYFGMDKIKKEGLDSIIKSNASGTFLTIYDDHSQYIKYLVLINSFNRAFKELRNQESVKRFNKPLDSITRDQFSEIKNSIPMKTINGVSFNDLKKLDIYIPELTLLTTKTYIDGPN